jgi:hypothetical protein
MSHDLHLFLYSFAIGAFLTFLALVRDGLVEYLRVRKPEESDVPSSPKTGSEAKKKEGQ